MDKNGYVYADNSATTRVCDEAIEAMQPYFKEYYGNPSSIYSFSNKPREALNEARKTIAAIINAEPDEIIFTSGGTESDNNVLFGAAYENEKRGRHIITSQIEHHAILHSAKRLEKEGFSVTYLPVDSEGFVSPETLAAAITPETTLVSVMMANNEIGTIEPVAELGRICREKKILFHTDAVQAVGHIPVDVKAMNIDLLSASAHKFNGPRGVGFLYMRRGSKVRHLVEGGGQERGRRGGTENVAYIVGLAKALEDAVAGLDDMPRIAAMRDRLAKEITEKIPYSRINGGMEHRLPGNINISFEFIEGESLILLLDMAGICASTGSACSTASLEPSHVLLSIGLPAEKAHGSLRLTISHENTDEDIDYILEKLPPIVQRLRDMSPLYEQVGKSGKTEE